MLSINLVIGAVIAVQVRMFACDCVDVLSQTKTSARAEEKEDQRYARARDHTAAW